MTRLIFFISLFSTVNQLPVDTHYSELALSITALNRGLESKTNIIYTDQSQPLDVYAAISRTIDNIPSLLFSQNISELISSSSSVILSEPMLMTLPVLAHEQTLQFFKEFPVKMQRSDFLIVGCDNADNWLNLLATLWALGYPNILIYNVTHETEGEFFTSDAFPHQRLQLSGIKHYLWARRHWFDNLKDWQVRVGLSNNPPRTLVYPDQGIFGGYVLMLLREFLSHRGASFVPTLTSNYEVYSPNDCLNLLRSNQCDLCGDWFALSHEFSYTDSYMYLYCNILIPTSQPKSKNFYISAPLQLRTWCLIVSYVLGICSFASFVGWLQHGRLEFGHLLLQIFGSLLSVGFKLRQVLGRLHYILFTIIALGGLICSTYYLAFLKTILATGLYDPQISSFEQLVGRNISLIVGEYDKTVLQLYDFPDILWRIVRVMPYAFILSHRRVFDTRFAYLAHSDRLALFRHQQQYMAKPRMRPLPIDISHSLPGFPMRRDWLLKFKLSESLLNSFASGLVQKLAEDTNRQTIHIGYLSLIPSEDYEARPLTLDFFAMPLKILIMGIALAFVCFLAELLFRFLRGSTKMGMNWATPTQKATKYPSCALELSHVRARHQYLCG
ncbi:hypothetical protein ACLKA7_000328 [Drosophila subpalustris]